MPWRNVAVELGQPEQAVRVLSAVEAAGKTSGVGRLAHAAHTKRILAEVRQETGLPVVTEVVDVSDVDLVAEYADMLQVGTRNAQNFSLLQAAMIAALGRYARMMSSPALLRAESARRGRQAHRRGNRGASRPTR